jgi:membrane-anchored protein YejM (alkaline phosphatase superfamily)
MYNFFIDGFVINLLYTPGGIEALGLSQSFYISAALGVIFLVTLYFLLVKTVKFELLNRYLPRKSYVISAMVLVFLTEASLYSWASFKSNSEILTIASRVAWHVPVTSRHTLMKMGFERSDQVYDAVKRNFTGKLTYPITPLDKEYKLDKRYPCY